MDDSSAPFLTAAPAALDPPRRGFGRAILGGTLAVLVVLAAATGVRWLLAPVLGTEQPFAMYLLAVAVAAWWRGAWAALATALCGGLLGYTLFLSADSGWSTMARVTTYAGFALFLGWAALRGNRKYRQTQRVLEKTLADLRLSERRLQMALTAGGMMAWETDLATGDTITSEQGHAMWGFTRAGTEDFVRQMHPDDLAPLLEAWRQAVETDTDYVVEFRVLRPSGTRWYLSRGRVVRDAQGIPRRMIGVTADLTQQRQASEGLRRLTETLSAMDRRKDQFIATLAHELRNPLAPLRNSLQVLKLVPNDVRSVTRAAQVMDRQLTALTRLVDDLLDVNRISRGAIELRKARVSARQLVEDAVETSRPLLDARGHVLDLVLPDAPVTLDVDAGRITQCLANLLNNAARYTPPGGRVQMRVEARKDHVDFIVEDNGSGIESDMLEQVFEMFTQVPASARAHEGLGIGLNIVRSLVQLHGGTVRAESEGLGRGSRFTICLPR